MAKGKHFSTQKPAPRFTRPSRLRVPKRRVLIVALACVLALAGIGGVVAWLTGTDYVINMFDLGRVETEVNEDGPEEEQPFKEGDNVKQNVDVTNSGNVPIYVRAQVNIYWQDANGNQLWEAPEKGTDYTIDWGDISDTGWKRGADGFYYWTEPLKAGETTGLLIKELKWVTAESSNGRKLVCDIAVQGIQAEPAEAVQEAWGVTITEGAVTPVTTTEGAGE